MSELDVYDKLFLFQRVQQLEAELATTKKHLVDANRGAEVNGKVNRLLGDKVIALRAELARKDEAIKLVEKLAEWSRNFPRTVVYNQTKLKTIDNALIEIEVEALQIADKARETLS